VTPPRAAFLILAAALVLAAAPASARTTGWEPYGEAWYNVTLVTTGGHTLDELKVQWLTNGARLRVTRKGGAYRDYKPEEIRELRTADGADLTAAVAAARPGGADRDDDRQVLGRNREPKIFSQSLDVGFGYAMVMGEWFGDSSYGVLADMDEGLNAHAGVRVGLTGRSYLRLLYRHQLGNIEPVFDSVDSVWVDLDGTIDELTLLFGKSLTEARAGESFAVAELGAGALSRRITGPDQDDRVTEFSFQLGLLVLKPLDDSSAVEFGASLSIKPTWVGEEGTGGALMRAYLGYSFVGW
jgi:hypothetical protein